MENARETNAVMTIADKIVWIITVFLFSSFYIFESYTWGRYIFLGVMLVVFVISAFKNGMKYKSNIENYQMHFLAIILFTLMSAVWGWNRSDPIQKTITLFEIFVCMFVLYNYYRDKDNGVSLLLQAVKWSSYVVSIYSLYFYGVNFIYSMVASGIRISNEYSNINSIGMLAAIGIVIQIDEILLNKKFKIASIFCVPSFYMLIATQSRKAFVLLLIGIIISAILRNIDNKNIVKTIVRVLIIAAVLYVAFIHVIQLPIFEGINSRMLNLIAAITGTGDMGRSATIRNSLARAGIEQFLKTPIFGIGIGCPHIVAQNQVGFNTYLHNNYVELLAGGGIFGFLIYYSMYFELVKKYWQFRKYESKTLITCIMLVVIFLVMDYGMVSLYSKDTYFYFMIFFLQVEELKRLSRNKAHEPDS